MENKGTDMSDSCADEWKSEQAQRATECDSDSNTFEDDQPITKIKPEVELKEENDGFVYKTDMQGNLKLVCSSINIPSSNSDIGESSLNEITSSHFGDSSVELKQEYLPDKIMENQNEHIKDHIDTEIPIDTTVDAARYSDSFPSYSPHSIMTYPSEDEPFDVTSNVFPDLSMEWTRLTGLPESLNSFFRKHFNDIGDEKTLNKSSTASQPSSSSSSPVSDNSKICSKSEQTALLVSDTDGSTFEGCEKEPFANFTVCKGRTSSRKSNARKKEPTSKANEMTEAEKKRLYRQKIKDTNPKLWQEIKQRDAAQKREKRAQRQMVAREMQMQLELEPSHSQNVQSLYLDALKERYPDLWEQLLHTVPEVRNRIDHKSRGAKSVAAYKDIIEAEKKRLYREKIKREKPEMWERQKARDAQRRNSQRLKKNTKRLNDEETVKTEKLESHSSSDHKKFAYLQNLEVNPDLFTSSQNSASNLTPLQSVSSTEMDYSNSRMNSFTSRKFTQNHPCGMTGSSDTTYTKDSIKLEDNPSSTQSKILWFWNDTPEFPKISKFIPNDQGNADTNQELKYPSVNAIKCEQINELDNKSCCKRVSKSKCGKE